MRPYAQSDSSLPPVVSTADRLTTDFITDWQREQFRPPRESIGGAPIRWDVGDEEGQEEPAAGLTQQRQQWQVEGTSSPPPPPPSFPPPPPPLLSLMASQPHQFMVVPPPPPFAPPLPPSIDEAEDMARAAEWSARVTPAAAAEWQPEWQEQVQLLETAGPARPLEWRVQELQSAATWSPAGQSRMEYDEQPTLSYLSPPGRR